MGRLLCGARPLLRLPAEPPTFFLFASRACDVNFLYQIPEAGPIRARSHASEPCTSELLTLYCMVGDVFPAAAGVLMGNSAMAEQRPTPPRQPSDSERSSSPRAFGGANYF